MWQREQAVEYLNGQREHLRDNAYARNRQPDVRTFDLLAILSLRQQLSQHKILVHTVRLNEVCGWQSHKV